MINIEENKLESIPVFLTDFVMSLILFINIFIVLNVIIKEAFSNVSGLVPFTSILITQMYISLIATVLFTYHNYNKGYYTYKHVFQNDCGNFPLYTMSIVSYIYVFFIRNVMCNEDKQMYALYDSHLLVSLVNLVLAAICPFFFS
jgi:hypothetical protein